MDTNNNSNFVRDFAGSLRDWGTGLDPDPSGPNSLHVKGCMPQLEFDDASSIAINGRIPVSRPRRSTDCLW